jgi:homoserine O-succinyltransferase
MPILVDRGPAGCRILAGAQSPAEMPQVPHRTRAEWIEIGLLNNMPEAALEATEQQFLDLLGLAVGENWVHLRFFALPGVPRGERGRSLLSRSYLDMTEVRTAGIDGLIVTGTEPKAQNLIDEPYWGAFAKLVDWARHNTISTIWSCLASHAAVLHLDGIDRIPLKEKCFGVFDCERVGDHPLTMDLPPRTTLPHSRWNALSEEALVAHGYEVLMKSPEAGVDTFMRQEHMRQAQSLFLFFQGHPEYDERSLLNEYRRDVGRFLRRERDHYPAMPCRYFDERTADALAAFERRAASERGEGLLAELPVPAETSVTSSATWRPFAVAIYRNWLAHISAQKRRRLRPAQYVAPLRLDKAPAAAI